MKINKIMIISILLGALLIGIGLAPKATFAQTANLALNKPATASSIEVAGFEAAKAVDGSTSTRWSSAFSDPQWIQVDLGATYTISQVVLNWEAAYGRSYQIQVSANASSWTTVYSTATGDGGTDTLSVSGSGRYVRMNGTARGTQWGYSLWEFQVYGGGAPTTPPPTTQPGQAPYGGTPAAVPGTIQAENYDTGGEGVAYHDTTAGNSGGAYRADGVDIEATTDTGGYNVGWTAAGEWLEYTVNVDPGGNYNLMTRVASQSGGGSLHVEVDGVNVTGTLSIPSTGAWQTWTTVTSGNFSLPAGQHVVRIAEDAAGFNLNWVTFVGVGNPPTTPPPTTPPPTTQPGQAPYGGTAWAIPGTIQAENYDTGGEGVAYHDTTAGNSGGAYRTDGVDVQATTDTGGGYNIGWTAAGEWLEYTVSVATSGTYSLNARVASQSGGGSLHVEIDGANVTGALAIPSTGAWQTWTTVTRTGVSLAAGQHVMRIAIDAAGFNLSWVSLQSGTPPPTTPPPTTPPPTTPPANKIQWAGVRSSRYGISPFPDACGWTKAMTTMSGYFPGSTPSATWLTGGIFFSGTNSGQDLNFPNPGGTWDSRIHFANADQNESYLTYFDTHGIKVFLQFEPGFAPLDQLFQVAYNRYGQHPSVIGFGVDVEWYQSQCDGCANAPVSDSTAQAWENKVKSLNPSYRLFIKHFDAGNLPPSYRGNIIFVDDSQQHGSYSNFLNEMVGWANTFYPADVIYQIGYPADKPWWSTLANPIPKTIGDELARRTPQSHIGILWVDFSLRDVLPTTCP